MSDPCAETAGIAVVRVTVDHLGCQAEYLDRRSAAFHRVTATQSRLTHRCPRDDPQVLPRKDDHVGLARTLQYVVSAVVATREDLSSRRADNRMSAYVYGDILVLAATAGVHDSAIRCEEALLVVLGNTPIRNDLRLEY